MNKQKINAYLQESLKPWHPSSMVVSPVSKRIVDCIEWASDVNAYIKNLIKDKS